MPTDLNRLTEGWLELESDPGLFTLLLEDFGVRGVQVEEIYDLQKPIEGPVYGFIFLFKWIEERRSRRKVVVTEESFVEDDETVNSIFFAQQMVPNSCATHALLSVLLNCPKIHLGPTLTRLKNHTKNMSPENKGYAIGNTPELARAHNSHAKPEPRHLHEKSHGMSTGRTMEAFHFVSYVPINGRLFELDGLRPNPIDHGPWAEGEDWTEKFGRVITERLGIATGGEPYHDIRFNLMAVVPDRRIAYEQKLRILKTNRQIVLEALQQLVKLTHPELTSDDHAVYMAAVNKSKSKCACRDQDNSQGSQLLSTSQKQLSSHHTPISSGTSFPKLPPALDSHNYAKSPLMEGVDPSGVQPRYENYSGSDYSDEDNETMGQRKNKPKVLRNEPLLAPTENSEQSSEQQQKQPETNAQVPKEANESDQNTMEPLTINTSTDFMKPLTIQTKFQPSPTPSASSTDTSSEAGSAFNSPVRSINYNFTQGSPNSAGKNIKSFENALFEDVRDIKKFLVIRVTSSGGLTSAEETIKLNNRTVNTNIHTKDDNSSLQMAEPCKKSVSPDEVLSKRVCLEANVSGNQEKRDCAIRDVSNIMDQSGNYNGKTKSNNDMTYSSLSQTDLKSSHKIGLSKHPHLIEPHRFAPKDLLALLKTVENEISICESNLRDEIEKRKKYKVDDCRRTHCYDQFICTFLSMLAEQGKLADLVEQQLLVRRRQGIRVGRLHKTKKPDRRRKSRTKRRK